MLHTRGKFEAFIRSLKATTLVEQWEASVAKVGGKVFALIGLHTHGITIKVSETSFEGLTSLEGIHQAAYFAKGGWVSVAPGALPDADLKAYLREAHKLVATRLTRKLRAELGLD